MKPLKTNPDNPMQVLILVEQKTVLVDTKEKANPEGPDEYRVLQHLTEEDKTNFYNKLETLLNEYGFKTDHYGEKSAMIKRFTIPKAKSEYE